MSDKPAGVGGGIQSPIIVTAKAPRPKRDYYSEAEQQRLVAMAVVIEKLKKWHKKQVADTGRMVPPNVVIRKVKQALPGLHGYDLKLMYLSIVTN